MKPMEHSAFPSDETLAETLAAFIDGRLDEETRKSVVAHVVDCEDCYGTIEAAGAWQRESAPPAEKVAAFPGRKPRHLVWAAAAVVTAGLLLYPLSLRYPQYHDDAQLREAANEMPFRATDARLSLDLAYQEQPPTNRGTPEDSSSLKLLAAAAQVQEDAQKKRVSQHSLAIAFLLTGQRDEAASIFGKAMIDETGAADLLTAIRRCTDVALLNDLSAAHGAIADFRTDATSSRIANEAAMRAWQLDPKSPITAWNRAVAIERVDRAGSAAAWRDYLAIDGASRWSTAAKERLSKLSDTR